MEKNIPQLSAEASMIRKTLDGGIKDFDSLVCLTKDLADVVGELLKILEGQSRKEI